MAASTRRRKCGSVGVGEDLRKSAAKMEKSRVLEKFRLYAK